MNRILKHLLWIIPSLLVLALVSLFAYTASARRADADYHSLLRKTLEVASENFQNQQEMPIAVSCKGKGMAPHIQWTHAPEGTKSYALIAMDWDAPSPRVPLLGVIHWVLYNIPADTTELPEGSSIASLARKGIVSGLNIAGQPGFLAPCPPIGTHRYEFRVYALDVARLQPASNDKRGLTKAMDGHILAYGELVGLKRP